MVGSGERARAWRAVLAQSSEHRAVDWEGSLEAALAGHPTALVAADCEPRAASRVADLLAQHERRGLVTPPLFTPPERAGHVLLAHGWVSLPAERWLAKLGDRFERAAITVRGLPDAAEGDLDQVLWQALAWVRRVFPTALLRDATLESDGEAVLELEGPVAITLSASCAGQSFDAVLAGPTIVARASWRPHEETHVVFEPDAPRPPPRVLRVAPPAERDLAMLLGRGPVTGDDVSVARAIAADLASIALPPPTRSFRVAAARAAPDAELAAVGLAGELPEAPAAGELSATVPREPFEVLAFRAGHKPVVLLTVSETELDSAKGWLAGAHVEIRERGFDVGAHDVWRAGSERRFELFASREPELAHRAAELHADPSASCAEMGELLGYPRCCVAAFCRQRERGDNTYNRHAAAARTRTPGPWPWELNDTWLKLVPFFPCSYTCAAALRAAHSVAALLPPGLEQLLAQPTLYLAHDNAIALFGSADADGTVRYREVRVTPGAAADVRALAAALGAADTLKLNTWALTALNGARELFSMRRTDPGLGVLMPFGARD